MAFTTCQRISSLLFAILMPVLTVKSYVAIYNISLFPKNRITALRRKMAIAAKETRHLISIRENICMKLFVLGDGENQLKAKIELIIALVVTAILIVYGLELSIRLLTGASERIEYLVVALVIIALLLLVDLRLYGNYKKEKLISFVKKGGGSYILHLRMI